MSDRHPDVPHDRARLLSVWRGIESGEPYEHTSIVVPSLSVDQDELSKIEGASFYEERLLFSLMRLRNPQARVVYVTSQPIHPDIVDYYLQLLHGVPARHARERLTMLCVYDASPRPLTHKILERPRVVERIRAAVRSSDRAYLTVFNATAAERELADRLGVALNGVDPTLLDLGGKSGAREVFTEAGIDHPLGVEHVRSRDDIVAALAFLARERPRLTSRSGRGPGKAVVKLNESFAGAGNALYRYPALGDVADLSDDALHERLREGLDHIELSDPEAERDAYFAKLATMGGIVEEFLEADEVRSPSVQLRLAPDGEVTLVSTHDQVLGGPTGQMYIGCRFPADAAYRATIQDAARRVGEVLRRHGVISRFAIDFLVVRAAADSSWRPYAIEINLRMGGTTPPYLALQFMTGGRIDSETGRFLSTRGQEKFYYATDHLRSPAYRGLLPDDLIDIMTGARLGYDPSTETGVIFHMIGAVSQYGKLGVTCIGDSRAQADDLYRRIVETLDRATAEGVDASLSLADSAELVTSME